MPREAARNSSLGLCGTNQLEQLHRAWVDAMEAMPKSRNNFSALCNESVQFRFDGQLVVIARVDPLRDRLIQLHALLSRAAVDVVQRVDGRRHRAVDGQTARHGHSRNRNRWRLRTMVNSGDQRSLQQFRLRRGRHFAPEHQPDHLSEAQFADQLLNRITADNDFARTNVDDRG